jgi:hypothetical protein
MIRQTEYILAAVIGLYIVFFTRPAPAMVRSLLVNPVAQLVALATLVWVGSTQSLLVALLLGIAYVASVPSREYADDASMKPKCKEGETYDAKQKKCVPSKPAAPVKAPTKPAAPKTEETTSTEPKAANEKLTETFVGGGIDYAPY